MSHDGNKWAVNQLPLSFARDSTAWRRHGWLYNLVFFFTTSESYGEYVFMYECNWYQSYSQSYREDPQKVIITVFCWTFVTIAAWLCVCVCVRTHVRVRVVKRWPRTNFFRIIRFVYCIIVVLLRFTLYRMVLLSVTLMSKSHFSEGISYKYYTSIVIADKLHFSAEFCTRRMGEKNEFGLRYYAFLVRRHKLEFT